MDRVDNELIPKLIQWAKNCQVNMLHKLLIVQAERMSKIEKNYFAAVELYEKAIQVKAIACSIDRSLIQ